MIFRRRKPEGGGEGAGDDALAGEITPPTLRPLARPATGESAAKPILAPSKPPTIAVSRPSLGPGPDMPRRAIEIPNAPKKGERAAMPSSEGKKLIVGRDIVLNGQISACERLIVEGRVEAELTDCRNIEIAEAGTFKGSAAVEVAEISGRFEGSLTVHERLTIRGTGQVTGSIRYGRIEIEQGGEINGDVKSLGTKAERPARAEPAIPAAPRDAPTIPALSGSGEP